MASTVTVKRYKMVRICGWCGRHMGFTRTSDPECDGKTTHGMCAKCADGIRKQHGLGPAKAR